MLGGMRRYDVVTVFLLLVGGVTVVGWVVGAVMLIASRRRTVRWNSPGRSGAMGRRRSCEWGRCCEQRRPSYGNLSPDSFSFLFLGSMADER